MNEVLKVANLAKTKIPFFHYHKISPIKNFRIRKEGQSAFSSYTRIEIESTPSYNNIKHFRDGATPIVYKEKNIDGNPPEKHPGHFITDYKFKNLNPPAYSGTLALVLEEGHLPKENEYKGFSLIKKSDNKWYIYNHDNNTYLSPIPNNLYNFVTMPDNTIRITMGEKGVHHLLANNAKYVRFAGSIEFDKQQKVKYWDNQSGAYMAPPFLAFQAGFFGELSRFKPICDRNDPEKNRSEAFTK